MGRRVWWALLVWLGGGCGSGPAVSPLAGTWQGTTDQQTDVEFAVESGSTSRVSNFHIDLPLPAPCGVTSFSLGEAEVVEGGFELRFPEAGGGSTVVTAAGTFTEESQLSGEFTVTQIDCGSAAGSFSAAWLRERP